MTDEDFAAFAGIGLGDVPKVPPARRAALEALAPTIDAVMLHDAGLGPLPRGVIVCRPRRRHR